MMVWDDEVMLETKDDAERAAKLKAWFNKSILDRCKTDYKFIYGSFTIPASQHSVFQCFIQNMIDSANVDAFHITRVEGDFS